MILFNKSIIDNRASSISNDIRLSRSIFKNQNLNIKNRASETILDVREMPIGLGTPFIQSFSHSVIQSFFIY